MTDNTTTVLPDARALSEHPCWTETFGGCLAHRHWFARDKRQPTCERCGTLIDGQHNEVGPVSWARESDVCPHGIRSPWQCHDCDAVNLPPAGYDPLAATPPASDAPASGAGFVLVPVEPTEEMVWAYKYCPYEGARDKWSAMLAAAPKVASDTGAELREALLASLAKRSIPTMDAQWSKAFNAALDMVARDTAAALATDATDGATGGGEVEPVAAMLICDQTGGKIITEWPVPWYREQEANYLYGDTGGYRIVPLFTTPSGDLLEQAARVADDLASVAERGKQHPHPLPCDTNEAWRRVEDACRDIAAAIRALSARNLTEGGEK